MILRLLLSLELLLLAALAARAQTAEEIFNSGAQFYISNNIPAALGKVEGGRKLYPEDVKLKKLEELLKQQQQQQQNNQQQSQNQQKQQDQQNKQQSQPDRKQQDQQTDKQKQEQQQPAKSAGKQSDEKQDGQTGQAQAAAAQEMSPEQAQRLLDAQKGDEQFLQLKPKTPPESPNKPIKDW
jgi:hypothetical protein